MEIRIGKSAKTCETCGREFVHEESLHSLAHFGEEGLLRQDYCASCWNGDIAKKAFSAWTTRFYDPKVAEQQPPEVFSPLRQLFYDASESEERTTLAMAYLAAQLLKRQKVFRQIKESDESDGEVKITLYADRIGNRLIEVRDPNFTFAEMDAARVALLGRLRAMEDGGAEPASPAAADDGTPPDPPEETPQPSPEFSGGVAAETGA